MPNVIATYKTRKGAQNAADRFNVTGATNIVTGATIVATVEHDQIALRFNVVLVEELPEGDEITDLHLADGSCCDENEAPVPDTASSVSRQHYIDTGHYGDRVVDGWLVCSTCDSDDDDDDDLDYGPATAPGEEGVEVPLVPVQDELVNGLTVTTWDTVADPVGTSGYLGNGVYVCDEHDRRATFQDGVLTHLLDGTPCGEPAPSTVPVTLYIATSEVRGYTVTAYGATRQEATALLQRELENSEAGQCVLALYGTRDAWLDEVNVHEATSGTAAWL